MIQRMVENQILDRIFKGKVILLFGPRQVGKTTLVKRIIQSYQDTAMYFNGDEPDVQQLLRRKSSAELKAIIGSRTLVVIDEAQRIENIGLTLKLMVDQFPEIQIIATGSSAFDLADQTQEPLTGRKYEFYLFPIAFAEMAASQGLLDAQRLVNHRMIFGYYPEIITKPGEEAENLRLLANSYLYKDIFAMQEVRKPVLLQKVLQALAFQMGSEVSYHEIAQLTGSDNQTVERYIDLLEKAFVVFRLNSFSRNLRNELKRSKKIYFWDNGIRNAVISNFNPVDLRQDTGALWENFMVSERQKINHYNALFPNIYFWRTHQQQEIDYLESMGGQLQAYEFAWNVKNKKKLPTAFAQAYPDAGFTVVTPENMQSFVMA
ncbi:MAG: ATP-binding protein [Saprospiraceae bacterium]|nr:ATP-binding protein [Saprospiraceae bacterium]